MRGVELCSPVAWRPLFPLVWQTFRAYPLRSKSLMRIGTTIGSVTLSRFHPAVRGAQWKLVVPMSVEDLDRKEANPNTEELVAYDQLGAGVGEWVAFSEGAEAAMPFFPNPIPIDAYCAAILDTVVLESGEEVIIEEE